MKYQPLIRAALLLSAWLLLFLAGWSLLWVFSSYSMAFSTCSGSFDFFAENLRCRQPYFAMLLFSVSLALAVVLFIWAARRNESAA
jgi:TRAP-type C4-dicarboxylate transport system permease small subunit